ncbi:NUDIX hydrolase domain-like protein [Diplogelasinospora grovesii]|uniref:NUDIX hydrolase domain-like protein n=1 Tax=Diplogelasinospora grovesii TaxID=303347 RepID=A0AAN6S8X8_9PEZI|nr:NUDIX hydrolase domain-like protein [Diplogelasinospora grovesii]
MAKRLTTLDLVKQCDSFPSEEKDPQGYAEVTGSLYTLIWKDDEGSFPIGWIPPAVLDALTNTPESVRGPMDVNPADRTILLFNQAKTYEERTALVAQLTAYWRANQTFRILKGWRDELWPVYGRNSELLFSMERSAVGLFGATRYGVHLSAFIRRTDDGKDSKYDLRIWVPKRAATKSTYAGMLDNTVAGGLMTNEDPFDCICREADEEASLPEEIVRKQAKETGTVTYIYVTDERSGGEPGYIYPECQWIYDLELPADGSIVPEPKDGEVESFSLRTVEEIQEQLAQGLWKPNCAMVQLDFFLRHGILTPENEPAYEELRTRAHRYIPFPGPHHKYHPSENGTA